MTQYVLTGLDINTSKKFYARCEELGVVGKFLKVDNFLCVVLELSNEDAIVLKLTFPDMDISKLNG